MATTDARTGFRLPWSSDHRDSEQSSPDTAQTQDANAAIEQPAEASAGPATAESAVAITVGTEAHADAAPGRTEHNPEPEETTMTELAATSEADPVGFTGSAGTDAPAPAPTPARRPSKFLADLTKAMQAAAEAAREETVGRLQADAKTAVEDIHGRSSTEAAELRRRADDDVSSIREWSKQEIARIREETEQKVSDRKAQLEREIDDHAALIEHQIDRIQARVTTFEAEMAAFFERLLAEEDPTRFAEMAESLPEPAFDETDWSTAPDAVDSTAASTPVGDVDPESTAEPVAATDGTADGMSAEEASPAEAIADAAVDDTEAAMAAIQAAAEAAEVSETAEVESSTTSSESSDAPVEGATEPESAATEGGQTDAGEADAAETDDPRLAALGMSAGFAAAEAEAAVAAGTTDEAEEIPLIADEALAARLAGLVPSGEGDDAAESTAKVTQVVVVGLVSVASIASFKRHLGRLTGVQSVGVTSGPDGEFVFAVTHVPEIVLRDLVPTLPGFQARVTGGNDDTVEVTARDPESEG